MSAWGFWMQFVGTVVVMGGLLWTWVSWSPSKAAEVARGWFQRQEQEHASVSPEAAKFTVTINSPLVSARPQDTTTELLPWITYLEDQITDVRRQHEAARAQAAKALADERDRSERDSRDLRARLSNESKSRDEQVRSVTLNGILVAALGTLLTLVGMWLSYAAS